MSSVIITGGVGSCGGRRGGVRRKGVCVKDAMIGQARARVLYMLRYNRQFYYLCST